MSAPAPAPTVVDDAPEEREDDSADRHDDVRARALLRMRGDVPSWPARVRRGAWILAFAFHVMLIVLLRLSLRDAPHASGDATPLQISLLDYALPEPQLPQPAPPRPPPHDSARTAVHVTARSLPPAPAAQPSSPDEAPLHIFNPDGSARIPDDTAARIERDRATANFIPQKVEPSPLLADKRPLKVRPNHFAKYWDGDDGKPLHETIWRHVTATKEFTAPWGGRYGCTWVLIIVACADVPLKPWIPPQTWKPATELDEY